MTTTADAPAATDQGPELALFRWDGDRYDLAAEAGAFEGRRVELLDGWVVDMAPIGDGHRTVEGLLRNELARRLDPDRWAVSGQRTVRTSPRSRPEPDVWVARGSLRSLATRAIEPTDLVLVAEVADTSLRLDTWKQELYAQAGVPTSWLFDVNRLSVEVRTDPVDGEYRTATLLCLEDDLVLTVDGEELTRFAVATVFP